jgi:hypothetical protein
MKSASRLFAIVFDREHVFYYAKAEHVVHADQPLWIDRGSLG